MDVQAETMRFRAILWAGFIVLLSGCWTWGELVYLVRGERTVGQVTEVYNMPGRDRPTPMIEFTFSERNGTARTGKDTAPATGIPGPGEPIAVQYTPGEKGRARRAGHVNWLGLVVFAISMSVLGFVAFRLIREGQEYSRARKRQ